MILIPALRRPDTSWKGVAATGTALTERNGNSVLTGSKVFVPFADAATHFLARVITPSTTALRLAIVAAGTIGSTTRLRPQT